MRNFNGAFFHYCHRRRIFFFISCIRARLPIDNPTASFSPLPRAVYQQFISFRCGDQHPSLLRFIGSADSRKPLFSAASSKQKSFVSPTTDAVTCSSSAKPRPTVTSDHENFLEILPNHQVGSTRPLPVFNPPRSRLLDLQRSQQATAITGLPETDLTLYRALFYSPVLRMQKRSFVSRHE